MTPRRCGSALVAAALLSGCGSTVAVHGSLGAGLDNGQATGSAGTSTGSAGTSYAPSAPSSSAPGAAALPVTGGAQRPAGPIGSAGPTIGGTGPAPPTVRSSRLTSPISVGFLVADYGKAARAAGFKGNGAASDPMAPFRRLIVAMNAQGGLAGRRIKPVFYTIDGTATAYETEAQAACNTFTQDNHVEAVVSANFVFDPLNACLTKAGVPQYDGSQTPSNDATGLRAFPGLFSVSGIRTDRSAAAVIDHSVRTGWLSSRNKLGVLSESCPDDKRTYSKVVVPLAQQHRIPVENIEITCFSGLGQASDLTSQISNAVLKMRSDGVDRVMYLGVTEGGMNTLFSQDADSQRWYPGYVLSTNALVEIDQANLPANQLANMHGAGWIPVLDTSTYSRGPAMRRCLSLNAAGQGPPPADVIDAVYLYVSCDPLFLLDASLRADGGAGGLGALRAATESLGSSYVAVLALGGRTSFGQGRHDGGTAVAVFSYKTACSCFSYDGAPTPLD